MWAPQAKFFKLITLICKNQLSFPIYGSNRPGFSILGRRPGRPSSLFYIKSSLFFGQKPARVLYFGVLYTKKKCICFIKIRPPPINLNILMDNLLPKSLTPLAVICSPVINGLLFAY